MARKVKCAEHNRLLLESIAALGRYGDTVRELHRLAVDRESAEFYQAWQASREARSVLSLVNGHLQRHKEKHGC
jgi:hypothetical protein